jgi:threonine synthase
MATATTGVFSDHARLECVSCCAVRPTGTAWNGCAACGARQPLVVAYGDELELRDLDEVWHTLTPVRPEVVLDLGQGRTPLVAAPDLAAGLFLKLEGQNPTGSHKDRFHGVAVGLARALGYQKVVTSSTGNHGAAAAAFAARAGLRSLVCLHPESPPALASQIAGYGGTIAVVPERTAELIGLLVDAGWYPSTGADPTLAGRGNPYGAEGYKAIAFEIVEALGDPPAVVAVPAASGDTVYGVWRGFHDLHERLGLPVPALLACQPAGAAPLALSADADAPREVADPWSLALSARDARSGWHASLAIRSGTGRIVTVEEDELAESARRLGSAGFYVEPASALSLAGVVKARATGLVAPDDTAVAVVTSSGLNWTRDLDVVFGASQPLRSVEAVLEALGEA